jgi:hypothetical protein
MSNPTFLSSSVDLFAAPRGLRTSRLILGDLFFVNVILFPFLVVFSLLCWKVRSPNASHPGFTIEAEVVLSDHFTFEAFGAEPRQIKFPE